MIRTTRRRTSDGGGPGGLYGARGTAAEAAALNDGAVGPHDEMVPGCPDGDALRLEKTLAV